MLFRYGINITIGATSTRSFPITLFIVLPLALGFRLALNIKSKDELYALTKKYAKSGQKGQMSQAR